MRFPPRVSFISTEWNVNAPKGYTVEQVQKVYECLYTGGTVYVDGSHDKQVLTLNAEESHKDEQLAFEELKRQENAMKRHVVLVETIKPLADTDVTIDSEVNNTCHVCRQGTVKEMAGCNTCTNFRAQLKCRL